MSVKQEIGRKDLGDDNTKPKLDKNNYISKSGTPRHRRKFKSFGDSWDLHLLSPSSIGKYLLVDISGK